MFIRRFLSVVRYSGWDEEDTFFRLEQSICDDVQSILSDVPAVSNVNELLDALRAHFGLVASVEQYHSELNRLRRGTLTLHALSLEVRRTGKAYPRPWSASTDIMIETPTLTHSITWRCAIGFS
jgi:hypothetical protein